MRAEDLFEAVGGIDDKLIARSDRRVRSSQEKPSSGKAAKRTKKRKSRRSVGAEIYRFTVVAMSTAVVVFLFLMARDLLGIRNLSDISIRNRIASTQESSIAEPMQAEEAAAEQAEESAVMRAEEAAEKAEASSDQRDSNEAEAEESSEVAENRAAGSFFGNKTAVDMLGDLKGDYVSLEIPRKERKLFRKLFQKENRLRRYLLPPVRLLTTYISRRRTGKFTEQSFMKTRTSAWTIFPGL